MTQVISKGVEHNINQEALFAAATKLNEVLSYKWDENVLNSGDTATAQSKTINTGDCNSSEGQRAGYVNIMLHRKCLDDLTVRPTAASALGSDSGEVKDIDDAIENNASLFSATASATSYKNNYRSSIDVIYANFGDTTAASQNMKKVTVSIYKDDKLVTRLSSYSANIGEINYFRRNF